jgi:hypothetical protein
MDMHSNRQSAPRPHEIVRTAKCVALFASQPTVAGARIRFVAAADRVRFVKFLAGLFDPLLLRAFPAAA